MSTEFVVVRVGGESWDCETVILVGAEAVEHDGHITMLSANTGPNTKHEFYALAQTALIQFQDEELEIQPVKEPLRAQWADQAHDIASGLALCRTRNRRLHVMAHEGLPWRKLLEAANRFCTRWIQLDVR
ncbi:MAG: hypothetical protein JRI36_07930 [Deltaproteobacteria bacterium]|nr:hypothetical protein [Deltaproteobacteria bacterium]